MTVGRADADGNAVLDGDGNQIMDVLTGIKVLTTTVTGTCQWLESGGTFSPVCGGCTSTSSYTDAYGKTATVTCTPSPGS